MNGALPYEHNRYSPSQSPYNVSSTSFLPSNQSPPLATYPAQPYYPNLSGPPPTSGNQLNGPQPYPGQPPASGPMQKPLPQSRVDPDMIPNVVRTFLSESENLVFFIKRSI